MPTSSGKETKLEKRARELGISPEELQAKRDARRAKRDEVVKAAPPKRRHAMTQTRPPSTKYKGPTHKTLQELYAGEYTSFEALRQAMIANGVVEHRVNPYDVIQRAIDDTFTDYALMRQRIEADSKGNIKKAVEHPLYPDMERAREAMVRYSTFAMQYDIQLRQLKLGEARVGVLAATLRTVLNGLGLHHEQIQKVPRLLIDAIKDGERNPDQSRLDGLKAEAIAEILMNDSQVEINEIEAEATDMEAAA